MVPAPVDGDGLVVDALPAGLAAVYCTPAHQYPLGARLSAARRVALVARARAEGFLVVEDDYDGELRYDVAPLPLLAALGPDVVVHLGTASKLLTPTLGVGWLVAPPDGPRRGARAARPRPGARPARAGQRVFAALAAHGDLGRHLRRLRRELAERRRAVRRGGGGRGPAGPGRRGRGARRGAAGVGVGGGVGARDGRVTRSPDYPIPHEPIPERIVCLTEETTETLYLLGQGDRIVGVSGYTVRPPEARQKPKVSAFINAKFDKIEALEPDLVLAFSDLQADLARRARAARHHGRHVQPAHASPRSCR